MTPAGLSDAQLEVVLADIDAANAADPSVVEIRGRSGPKELLHAQLMTQWLNLLMPDANAAQQVAARAHHLVRFKHPRSEYPDGRAGYLRWRNAAKAAHAEAVAGILETHDAADVLIDEVVRIVRKQGRHDDPFVQVHEDALCLVFLETQLDDLIDSLGAQRANEVLARTVRKMSSQGIAAASDIPLSQTGRAALTAAMNAGDEPSSP